MSSKCPTTLDFRLLLISSKLNQEIYELKPGGMLSDALTQELDRLTAKEVEFVSDRNDEHIVQTPLTEACVKGLTRVVKYLCQKGSPDLSRLRWVDPCDLARRKAPLLWIAVVNDNRALVDVLLDEGADINAVMCTGATSVSSACWLGLKDMVAYLIHRGADINIPNSTGGTCLMNCISDVSLCKILLRNGADLYARDRNQKTVLNHAIERNKIEIVEFVLRNEERRFEIDPPDAFWLLISALLSSPEMHVCVSFLYMYLSPAEKANVYEFWGCTVNDNYSTTTLWLHAAKIRRRYNVKKVIKSPKAVFEYRSECASVKEVRSLRSSLNFIYQILMILARILGPSHIFTIYSLETYLSLCAGDRRHSVFNRLCFLLLEFKIERYGFLNEVVTETSKSLIEHFGLSLKNDSEIQCLNFEVSFETLQLIAGHVQTNRVDILELPEEEQMAFDWNLKFVLFLILLTHSIKKSAKQDERFRTYIHEKILACGEVDDQLRTTSSGRTLLHLAVTKFSLPASHDVQRRRIERVKIFPDISVTELLLDCGAPINLADSDGSSPLFAALSANQSGTKIAKMLLSRGGHLERVGPNGNLVMDVRNRLPRSSMMLNLPRVLSLRCICALTLTTTGVAEDSIPPGLRRFVKVHRR